MDKSKTILREGYVYREEKLNGQADVLYCVLKPNTLSFHRRKVHKRHTPLGLLKLEELSVDTKEHMNSDHIGVDSVDCNHNCTRFPWKILAGEHKLFLYCASFEDRTAWVEAIEKAKRGLSGVNVLEHLNINCKEDYESITETTQKQSKLTSKVKRSVDSDQLLIPKSVDNSSHAEGEFDNTVRNDADSFRQKVTRVRSHSLSEVEKPSDVKELEQQTRFLKSKSAPPDHGKRGCKTVDKLIDVHSGLCRQLVRWI